MSTQVQTDPFLARAAPAPSSSWSIRILALCGLWLVVGATAWLAAGTQFWQAVAFWGCIFALGNLVRVVVVRRSPAWSRVLAVCLVVFSLTWYGIGAQFALGYVYIDNFSPDAVAISLDGRDWQKLESSAAIECRLRMGTYAVSVRSVRDGKELDGFEIVVRSQYGLLTSSTNNYVLNVLGAQRYRRGTVVYAESPEQWEAERETTFQQKWFKVDADYIFEDPPKFGRSGSTATYLHRCAPENK